jgi:hypothetical protein
MTELGYEGAASTDHDQQGQAVSLFITDMLAASIGQGNGVTIVAVPWFVPKLPDPGEWQPAGQR